ncbi:MAG: iron-siderophore ABC transporter substrate-binding protein [Actinomycetota bacterium]
MNRRVQSPGAAAIGSGLTLSARARWRRFGAVMAGVALVAVAGCSSSDDDGSAASTAAVDTTDTAATTVAPATTTPETTDAAETTAVPETTAGSDPAPSVAPTTDAPTSRIVEHAFGETEVPANAERIVVTSGGTLLPTLLALGIPVVGAPFPDEPIPTVLVTEDDLVGVESVGFPDISLERVAALDPDLIIGFDDGLEETYDEFSQIAPTIAIESDLNDWRGTAERIAESVDASDEMAVQLDEYDARVADLQEQFADELSSEVSVVRALGDQIRLHTRYHFAGQILDDVGFARPASQQTDDPSERFIQVSLEQLELADGDIVFVFGAGSLGSAGEGIDDSIQAIVDSPLYPTLRIANNGGITVVDPLAWQQGGLPAALLILDDIEATLANA